MVRFSLKPLGPLLGFCVVLAAGIAHPAFADREGHCRVAPVKIECVSGDVLDGEGILKPGAHFHFGSPTTRYAHGILGDAVEWGSLHYIQQGSADHGPYAWHDFELPQDRVFEDVAPRVADLNGDGGPEIIVVESQKDLGAQLAIYAVLDLKLEKIAATPHIGRSNRWLAPIGAADLDGDGYVEIAYIDRPHLAKTLRVWRFKNGTLEAVADLPGLTNHRIGERDIGGGIRHCNGVPELITASADWRDIVATRLQNGELSSKVLGPHSGRASLNAALRCN